MSTPMFVSRRSRRSTSRTCCRFRQSGLGRSATSILMRRHCSTRRPKAPPRFVSRFMSAMSVTAWWSAQPAPASLSCWPSWRCSFAAMPALRYSLSTSVARSAPQRLPAAAIGRISVQAFRRTATMASSCSRLRASTNRPNETGPPNGCRLFLPRKVLRSIRPPRIICGLH